MEENANREQLLEELTSAYKHTVRVNSWEIETEDISNLMDYVATWVNEDIEKLTDLIKCRGDLEESYIDGTVGKGTKYKESKRIGCEIGSLVSKYPDTIKKMEKNRIDGRERSG